MERKWNFERTKIIEIYVWANQSSNKGMEEPLDTVCVWIAFKIMEQHDEVGQIWFWLKIYMFGYLCRIDYGGKKNHGRVEINRNNFYFYQN